MKTYLLHPASKRRTNRGFTLLEMVIVLTIIGLLAGLAILALGDVLGGAKIQTAETDVQSFKTLLATYELYTQTLPTTEQGLKALWSKPTVEPIPDHWRAVLDHEVVDPWKHPYQYRNPGKRNPQKYDVFSMGPDGVPDTDDDIGNWQTKPNTP